MFDRSHSVDQFESAARLIVTSHNFMYADREGNIAYWQAGQVPVRPPATTRDCRCPAPARRNGPAASFPCRPPSTRMQGWLANWNNKPAVWYDNPDNRLARASRTASLDIQARLAGPQLISLGDMFDIPKDIGRVDVLGRDSRYLQPYLLRALDAVPSTHPLVAAGASPCSRPGTETSSTTRSRAPSYELGDVIYWVWQDKP